MFDYVRRGELSAERYAQVLLDRYKAHTNLNTVTYIDEARPLEDAREIDRARARGAQLGPLAGLPMMLKDIQPQDQQALSGRRHRTPPTRIRCCRAQRQPL